MQPSVGWFWESTAWWAFGIREPGSSIFAPWYGPHQLTDSQAANYRGDLQETHWTAEIHSWRWDGAGWIRAW